MFSSRVFNCVEDFHIVYSVIESYWYAVRTENLMYYFVREHTHNSAYGRCWQWCERHSNSSIVRQMILITTYINTHYDLWAVECIICWLNGGALFLLYAVRAYRFLWLDRNSIMRHDLECSVWCLRCGARRIRVEIKWNTGVRTPSVIINAIFWNFYFSLFIYEHIKAIYIFFDITFYNFSICTY